MVNGSSKTIILNEGIRGNPNITVFSIDHCCSTDDDDEKNTLRLMHGNTRGNPNQTVVNEPGLYSLILGSRKPEAKQFKRWITHEVIPSIRRNGMYATDTLLDDPDLLLKTVTRLTEERRARLAAEAQVIAQAPKVRAFDTFMDAEGTQTMNEVVGRRIRS